MLSDKSDSTIYEAEDINPKDVLLISYNNRCGLFNPCYEVYAHVKNKGRVNSVKLDWFRTHSKALEYSHGVANGCGAPVLCSNKTPHHILELLIDNDMNWETF